MYNCFYSDRNTKISILELWDVSKLTGPTNACTNRRYGGCSASICLAFPDSVTRSVNDSKVDQDHVFALSHYGLQHLQLVRVRTSLQTNTVLQVML